jgi:hypothetical protein
MAEKCGLQGNRWCVKLGDSFWREFRLAAEAIRMGLIVLHMLMMGIVAPVDLYTIEYRGTSMREHFKKFLWTSKFWAMLGLVGLVSGLYFQRVAANGSGLWCLGLMFLGAAYLEQRD